MFPKPGTRREKGKKRQRSLVALFCLLCLFVLLQLPALGYARSTSQEQQKEPLGSLSSIGDVSVNGSAAPVESTIFPGDTVRTGETGTATFTASGRGMLKISPHSEVVFQGSYQFTAELKSGTVLLSSISGPRGLTLRIENFVLVSYIRQQSAAARIEGANGSFLVSCLDGNMGVLTMESKSGQFLSAGQSLRISAGEALPTAPPAAPTTGHNFHSGWLYLGVGGAAAAAAAAGLAHGGAKQSVSPSSP